LVGNKPNEIKSVPVSGCTSDSVALQLLNISKRSLSKQVENANSISSQVEKSLKRPFEVLASSTASTSEFMEKLTQLQSNSNEKVSKSFKKLPGKYKQMILVAASTGEITLVDYDADAVEFFQSSSNLNAQILLNSKLEGENIDCTVSPAMTTSLMVGSFLWRNPVSPSGFASSVLTSEGMFRSDILHEGMVLELSTKFDISSESMKKLTKTQEEIFHFVRRFGGRHSFNHD